MKRNILFIFLILIFSGNLFAQNPLVKQWDYRFGGTNDDILNYFQKTTDGGFILGGRSLSDSSGNKTQNNWGNRDYWIIKIDSSGNKQWDRRYGGNDNEGLWYLEETNDKGFIIGGYSASGISGDKSEPSWGSLDYWIVKIDSLGNKQWDKRYGGNDWDELHSVHQTYDGGYILGGQSISSIGGDKSEASQGGYDFWIVKTDSNGTKQWDKRFGGSSADNAYTLIQTIDSGYLVGGYSHSGIGGDKSQPSWGTYDYWIVKTDSIGNKQWDRDFGGTTDDVLWSIFQTDDTGYILGGYSNSGIGGDKTQPSWGGMDYWVVKIDSVGTKQWDKRFGGSGNEYAFGNISKTFDDGYLLSGASYSQAGGDKTEDNLGANQAWIVKIDSIGNKTWDKTIFTNGTDFTSYAYQTSEKCFVIAEFTKSGIGGYKTQSNWDTTNTTWDYWIVNFCDTTGTTSINQIMNLQSQFMIYPNPTNSILNFYLQEKENIIVTNLLGEIVLHKIGEGKVELDVSVLLKGMYFITAGSNVLKFAKQ